MNATTTSSTSLLPADHILSALQRGGVFELGESYRRGEWDSSDLEETLFQIFTEQSYRLPRNTIRAVVYFLADRLRNPQTGKGAFEIAHRHYDLGNDLFSRMLDKSMSYTSGYWHTASTLDAAQEAKLELLCQKLQLAPGMTVLDIGCGWGNFAEYAARTRQVHVTGITVSKEQASLAKERTRSLPVSIEVVDYQKFSGRFDRIVSIEMIEAVGRKNMGSFFRKVSECLKPGGLLALQAISAETFTHSSFRGLDQYILWLLKHIFPHGYLPNPKTIALPPAQGLVLEDLHNFSYDYARTLRAWKANFDASWPALRADYGDEFARIWHFYLCGCAALFRGRFVQLYQAVYSKGGVPGGYHVARE